MSRILAGGKVVDEFLDGRRQSASEIKSDNRVGLFIIGIEGENVHMCPIKGGAFGS